MCCLFNLSSVCTLFFCAIFCKNKNIHSFLTEGFHNNTIVLPITKLAIQKKLNTSLRPTLRNSCRISFKHSHLSTDFDKITMKLTWRHKFNMRPFLCYGEVTLFLKTFYSFDQFTTLTYILMDKFCPCLRDICLCIFVRHGESSSQEIRSLGISNYLELRHKKCTNCISFRCFI